MARIRNIKPDFWTDEKLVDLEPWERLLFIGIWNFVDDEGYMPYSPKRIKMQVFPGDSLEISRGLQNLISIGALTLYDSEVGKVIRVTNWAKHQKVSNPTASKYRALSLTIDAQNPLNVGHFGGKSGVKGAASTEFSREVHTEGERVMEREGERNVVVKLSDAHAPDHDDEFDLIEEMIPETESDPSPGYPADFTAFWNVYPRRGGKGAACAAFIKAKKRAPVTAIIAGAERLNTDPNLPTDKTLIPHPATWLNQDRWEDDPLPQRQGSSSDQRLARGFQMVQQVIEREAPSNEFPEFPSDPRLMELER